MSNSLQPHGLQPTKLLHPWDFPGKSTGVGCHCLLQYEVPRIGKCIKTESGIQGPGGGKNGKLLFNGDRNRLKVKGKKMIHYAITNQKVTEVAILISYKIDFTV